MKADWKPMATAPQGKGHLILGWAKGEEMAVFCSDVIEGRTFWYTRDGEGLSDYDPTHWTETPDEPE